MSLALLEHSLLILPVPDINKTAQYYEHMLKFKVVRHPDTAQPHVCLYRDAVEIILTQSKLQKITPNRIMHGYGYDGYFTSTNIEKLYQDCVTSAVKIAKTLALTDYNNHEFVLEDIDGRWIGIGIKSRMFKT